MHQVIELETVDRNGEVRVVEVGLDDPSKAGREAVVTLVDGDERHVFRGADYAECLHDVWTHFETQGRQLCCQGARPDVRASGLLRDWSFGLQAYVLDPDRRGQGFEVVDVFAPAPRDAVGTMAEQNATVMAFYGFAFPGPGPRPEGGDAGVAEARG